MFFSVMVLMIEEIFIFFDIRERKSSLFKKNKIEIKKFMLIY